MKSMWKVLAIALFGLLTLTPVASARSPRIIIRGGFGFPVWVGPYWGPSYIYPYPYAYAVPVSNAGELKIKSPMQGASVYIDSGFVGVAGKVKKIPLPAGIHEVQLRDPEGETIYRETVEIIAGRTTQIQPEYRPGTAYQG